MPVAQLKTLNGPSPRLLQGIVTLLFVLAFLGAYLSTSDVWLGGSQGGLQLRPEPALLPAGLAFGGPGLLGTSLGLLLHNIFFRMVPSGVSLPFSLVQTAMVTLGGAAALQIRRRAPLLFRNLAATWTLSLFLVVPLGAFAAWEEGTTAVYEGQHILREVLLPINVLGFVLLEGWDLRRREGGWGGRLLDQLRTPGFRTLPFLLFVVVLVAFPSQAAARCFGEPETAEEEPSWSLGLRGESAHGLWNLAYLGVDPRATDGFDVDFDVIEPIFERGLNPQENTIGLFVYFFYPENSGSALGSDNPEATVALTRSVVPPRDPITWPLRVAYFFPGEMVLTLFWSPEAVRQSTYVMDLFTPFGERVAMANASTYSFQATPGYYDFTLQAKLSPAEGDLVFLAAVLGGYVIALVAFLWFRHARRRTESPPGRQKEA